MPNTAWVCQIVTHRDHEPHFGTESDCLEGSGEDSLDPSLLSTSMELLEEHIVFQGTPSDSMFLLPEFMDLLAGKTVS